MLRSRAVVSLAALLTLCVCVSPPAASAASSPARSRRPCAAGRLRLAKGPCVRVTVPAREATAAGRALAYEPIGAALAAAPAQRRAQQRSRTRRRALLPHTLTAAPRAAAAADLPLPSAPVFGPWQDDPSASPGTLEVERSRLIDADLPNGEDGTVGGGETQVRNKGVTTTASIVTRDTLTSCPDPGGLVRGTWEFSTGTAAVTAQGAFRKQQTNRATFEATVGDDARLQRFRYRAEVEIELGGAVPATGGTLRALPTQRFRTVFSRAGLDPRRAPAPDERAIARDYAANPPEGGTYHGPRGRTLTDAQAQALTQQALLTMALLEGDVRRHLLSAEGRWYDAFACVHGEVDGPGRLEQGDAAQYRWQPLASDGHPLRGPVQVTGATGVTVAPTSGAVAPGAPFASTATLTSDRGGSFDTLVTSRRGRGRATKAITAERPPSRRWQVLVDVVHHATMGDGVAPTHVEGGGAVELTEDGGFTTGLGIYRGSEWDGTIENICGREMQRARGFGGEALVGAQVFADGTVTVTFGVPARPFDMTWITTVPLATGGTETTTGLQPFCGEAGRAHTTTTVTVRTRRLEPQ